MSRKIDIFRVPVPAEVYPAARIRKAMLAYESRWPEDRPTQWDSVGSHTWAAAICEFAVAEGRPADFSRWQIDPSKGEVS